MRSFISICTIIFHLTFFTALGQYQHVVQNQYKFNYLTIDQGLSNNFIRSICQDSKGFIWFSTQSGLNKFNGQTNIAYMHHANDSTTISSNQIYDVLLDSQNKLWCAGSGGLDMYNNDYDNFTRFRHPDITWPWEELFCIAEDRNGKIWFGGNSGLYAYNIHTAEIEHFSNQAGNSYGLPPGVIYRLMVDTHNKLWISILEEGLYVLNLDDYSFRQFAHDPEVNTSISSNRIETFFEDEAGHIWIGTYNEGINLYLPERNSFKRYIPDPDNSYSTRVRVAFEDLKGDFFLGTRAGLYIFDKLNDKFKHYASEDHNFSKLSQNSVTTSYIDKSGTLWVGTFSGGVNFTNLKKKEFVHYTAGKDDIHFLSGSNIYAITEDDNGNLWVGGDNGLNFLDRSVSTFKYYTNKPNDPTSLSYNDVKAFEWDKQGNLWVATNKGGLNKYNTRSGKFKSYRHDPNNPQSISGDKVYCILNDKFYNLWVISSPISSFESLAIDILPNGSDEFIHLDEQAYFGLESNDNGDMYIGGVKGFWIFNAQDSLFSFISNDKYIGNTYTIRKDSKGILWVGSDKGLARYNPMDKSFKWYSTETGYPFSEVFGILEDDTQSLWISTNSGLIKISNIVKDTANIQVRVFDHDDGVQSKQFNYNAFYKCKSGEMAFGGINGFNTFFPDLIVENRLPADIILTDLKIFNTSVPIGEEVDGRIILEKSISLTKEIALGPKQNIFTIEFASPQNANPAQYTFKTKLVGLNKEWQYRKASNNFVTYTNLSAGEYIFQVTAANNDGFWNEEPLELKITVIPAFWETWLFRIFSGILIIILVWLVYVYRIRSIRRQNIMLEKTVGIRTHELSEKNSMLQKANLLLKEKQEEILSQNDELEQHRNHLTELVDERTSELETALEKAKESDALKSAFLANMSHEVRTPMNAIMGFSNILVEDDFTAEERAKYLQIIQSNSNSLLKIIDEIIDISLIESNQLKIVKEIFELNVVIDHLFSYYFLNTKNARIEVRKNNTLHDLNLKLNSDSIRIKQIVTNMMDNACKFTDEGYIEIGVHKDAGDLCIYVEDTGKGIPMESVDHIFQQFLKLEDKDSPWTEGLGLGLAISQKIADAMGGRIIVDSVVGKGSRFTFRIPFSEIMSENTLVTREIKESIPDQWRGKTILIAEDVEANFLYLKSVLRKTGTNILWAKNGEEVVEMAMNNSHIDLILMDIKMPVKDGYEAAQIIKGHNPKQIIVAQTAYARTREKYKFYDENFNDYISKPIDPSELIAILKRFL